MLSDDLKRLIRLSAPTSFIGVYMILTGLVDTAIVGHLGARQLSSVALVNAWLPLLVVFPTTILVVVQQLVARKNGANEQASSGAVVWNGLYATIPFVLGIIVAVMVWGDALVGLIGKSGSLAFAPEYLRIRILVLPALCVSLAIGNFFRGLGDARTPMVAVFFGNAINIATDFVFVFGLFGFPAMGVRGAALASLVGAIVTLVPLLVPFFSASRRSAYGTGRFRFDPQLARTFLRLGSPLVFSSFFQAVAVALFFAGLMRLGPAEVAVTAIVSRLQGLGQGVLGGVSVAATTEAGFFAGAKDRLALRKITWRAVRLGAPVGLSFAAIVLVGRWVWVPWMTSDAALRARVWEVLPIAALGMAPWGVTYVLRGALQGIGATKVIFLINTLAVWAVWIPLCALFMVVFELGAFGGFLAGFGWFLAEVIGYIAYFQSTRWHHHVDARPSRDQ